MKSKKIIKNILIALIICSAVIFTALHVRIGENVDDPNNKPTEPDNPIVEPIEDPGFIPPVDEDYTYSDYNFGEFLCKDIYLDGKLINNWEMEYPIVRIDDKFYFPATEKLMSALGLKVEFDDSRHWVKFTCIEKAKDVDFVDDLCACNLQYKEVYWDQVFYFNDGETPVPANIAVTAREKEAGGERMLYLSADALKDYSGIYFSYYFEDITGLYISTDREIVPIDYFCENNRKYIEGRARYMMYFNKKLDLETAVYYEYLFRHEAAQTDLFSEDLLMSVAKRESGFRSDVASIAIGIMEILYKYAELKDYSEEMLKDPHYNIEYGSNVLILRIKDFDGDLRKGLAAYNMGAAAIRKSIKETGVYRTSYADSVINNVPAMQEWIANKGYTNEFFEYVGK